MQWGGGYVSREYAIIHTINLVRCEVVGKELQV